MVFLRNRAVHYGGRRCRGARAAVTAGTINQKLRAAFYSIKSGWG
jgi:hypothetical protein